MLLHQLRECRAAGIVQKNGILRSQVKMEEVDGGAAFDDPALSHDNQKRGGVTAPWGIRGALFPRIGACWIRTTWTARTESRKGEPTMKSAIAEVLLMLTLCVVVVGFGRGWFALSSKNSETRTNKVDVNLVVDREKMNTDAQSMKARTTELASKVTEEAEELEKHIKDRSRVGNPSRQ
jgi:hypothetical protein